MPRFPRTYIKTIFFHIITQGINKSYIFERSEDIKFYLRMMKKLSKEQEVKILAYCVMSNHTHMLVKTNQTEKMSKFMQRLNTTYGIYYNQKYNRVGYVFRNRYKSEGIYNEKHLYNCVRYIYNNPVKAGICSQAKEYQYSNYKELNSKYKEINENLIDEYSFIDIEDDNLRKSENVIKEILRKYNKNLDDIRKNKKELKEFITILKEKEGISLRKIADELKLSRESVRRIYIK
jgi:putative transposase